MKYELYFFNKFDKEYDECVNCCKQLLHYETTHRVTWEELFNIPFIKQCLEEVKNFKFEE